MPADLPPPPDRMFLDGDRSVDLRTGALLGVWDDADRLTTRELELLAWLAARPGVVVRWEELHASVWRFAPSVVSRAPYFTWRRLVKKVEPDPEHPKNLISHHGDGVLYVPPVDIGAHVARLPEEQRRGLALLVALGGPVSPALFARAARAVGVPDVHAALATAGLLRDDGTPWRAAAVAVERLDPVEIARFWAAEPYESPNAPPEHVALQGGLAALIPPLPPAEAARVGLHLVRVLVHAGAQQDALVLAERLVPAAEPPTDRYLLAQRVRILGTLGLHDELEAACIPLLAMCEQAGDLRLTARTTSNLARARHSRGDSAGAVPLLERAREACHRAGDTDGEARTCLTLGTALSALGRWGDAERAVRAALVRAVQTPALQREARGQLALQQLMRGDLEAAEAGFAAIADGQDAFATHNYWFVRALGGHTSEAIAGLERLTALARSRGAETDELHHTSLAAMIALAVDDTAAGRLALEAEQVRQALGDRSPLPHAVRAVLAARRGDTALATRLAAPDTFAARFRVPLLCLLAEVALAAGDVGSARARLVEAGHLAARQHADPRSLYVNWAALAAKLS